MSLHYLWFVASSLAGIFGIVLCFLDSGGAEFSGILGGSLFLPYSGRIVGVLV